MTGSELNKKRKWGENDVAVEMQRMATAHYAIAKAEPGKLGYVKLNKILWYSDLEHYRWHGVSITGLKHYTRTPWGPMSREISRAVFCLVKERKVAERTKVSKYPGIEMISLERPDFAALTAEQIDIIDQMTEIITPLTVNQLIQMTRDDRLWQELKNHEAMPVGTGSVITLRPTSLATSEGSH